MLKQVELCSLDLRYEGCRMKSATTEKALLRSILTQGIRDPLQGVDTPSASILLDGFKRYRCAQKLSIEIVPYSALSHDEALGIIELLRIANAKSLSILEQAKLIDELKCVHHMSVSEIARLLEKSKAWVSVRVGLIKQMSAAVMDKILSGQFPVYAYMYTLRPFMRLNTTSGKDVDDFVNAVAGKNFSIRNIESLAHAYFRGSSQLRQQIKSGNVSWALRQLKHTASAAHNCSRLEQSVLRDLEIAQKYIQRLIYRADNSGFKSNAFFAQANLIAGGILRQIKPFRDIIQRLYDQSG
jgi:hypothetical protein